MFESSSMRSLQPQHTSCGHEPGARILGLVPENQSDCPVSANLERSDFAASERGLITQSNSAGALKMTVISVMKI